MSKCKCGHRRGVHLAGEYSPGSCDYSGCSCRGYDPAPCLDDLLAESKQREATLTLERDAAMNALEIARMAFVETKSRLGILIERGDFEEGRDESISKSWLKRIEATMMAIKSPTAALAERDRAIREECAVICENASLPNGENVGEYYASAIREAVKL